MPKWLVIGRNQYRLTMSPFRFIRPYFPYLSVVLLALYIVYIAPAMMSALVDEAMAFFLSQAAVAVVQIILFAVFIWFFFFPVSLALRDIQAGQLESLLSAPIKPSQLLLGEFVGVMPFYAIAVVIFAGIFTALLDPIGIGIIQTFIIVGVFVFTFFSALWIGTLVAALLRSKLGQSERGKDIGKALGFVLALPVVGIMYAMMGGGFVESLSDPGTSGAVTGILGVLPSSWGAKVVIDFASNPEAISLDTLTRFGGVVVFFVASMWLGFKLADRAYTLETGGFSGSTAGKDGLLYNTIRSLGGGGAFGTLLVSITKDYGRRLQNLSRVAYIVGLMVLINVFLVRPSEPFEALIMAQALFAMLAAFVVGEVTIRGKEALFIYRKAPSGESRLIWARIVQGWMITVPVCAAIIAGQMAIIPNTNIMTILGYVGIIISVSAAYVVFSLGLFLTIPAFSDKGGEF
ncbi:MAG: hypothetical protein HXS50_04185, partial [Theionarchaea archaeon]|nr:hypothetical protein [Theionarchaea archaeon]